MGFTKSYLFYESNDHSVGAKRIFLQQNCCKNLYQSEREHENNNQHQCNKVTQ